MASVTCSGSVFHVCTSNARQCSRNVHLPHGSRRQACLHSQPIRGRQSCKAHQTEHRRRVTLAVAAAAGRTEADAHLQLATAKIPKTVDVDAFLGHLYQWAASLTSNGRNLPLALPLRADKTDDGFLLQLLRVGRDDGVVSVGDIVVAVEPVESAGNVLFVRFYEGEGANAIYKSNGDLPRLLQSLVDVPLIVNTMPQAIRRAVMQASQ